MYSIEVIYPNCKHLPSNTTATDHLVVIPLHLLKLRKMSLSDTINKLFSGLDAEVLGDNKHIVRGNISYITLTRRWTDGDNNSD